MPTRIEYLRLGNRVYNALLKSGIDFVEELVRLSSADLRSVRGVGKMGAEEVKAKMKKCGYTIKPLSDNIDGWRFSKLAPKNEKNRSGGVGSGVRAQRSKGRKHSGKVTQR